MHTILVGTDLQSFAHIHPRLDGDGSYSIETTPLEGGTYRVYTEFVRDGKKVLDARELAVGGVPGAEPELVPDLSPKTVGGTTVALGTPETLRAGRASRLDFRLTDDGEPVTNISPYLGAAAHVAIVSEDGDDFAHGHGEAVAVGETAHGGEEHEGEDGPAHGVPESFGPGVRAEHTFESPGLYKLWAQFERDGRVITAPFVVEVRP